MVDERSNRRLAAILAADMVAYSRLMHEDEAGTVAAWQNARRTAIDPILDAHKGRVVKRTGDGFLAEFTIVEDAVRCAVAMQDALSDSPLSFRMGINLGDITDDGDDIHGDGVNIAARLEGLAEPGGICISRSVFDQVHNKIDLGFEDLGDHELKNIDTPVRTFRVRADGKAAKASPKSGFMRRFVVIVAATLIAALTSAGLWWWQPWIEREEAARPDRFAYALPDRPSIAIMPFANLSKDPQQEYFADGFTEDLITDVAQSKNLFVIARNSTFTYKGRAVKIRQIAEELGVRYVVEGSIRRIGEKMRITAQLIDAANGAHVWAKRYDEPMSKLFDVQDEISQEIAGALLASVGKADLAKATQKRPKELSAYDYVLQSRALLSLASREKTMQARWFAEQAIAIDPDYAPAYNMLGNTFSLAYILQWEGRDALERAHGAALKAVELDPLSSAAHGLLGRIFLRRLQYQDAVATHEKSITLNPNRADSYAYLADALTFMGRADEAIDAIRTAMRLDPFFPPLYDMYLGRAYYFSKQYDKAAAQLRTCAVRAPKFRPCYMFLAPTYAELGKQAETQRTVETLLKVAPKFSIAKSVRKHLPFVPSVMQFYISGLRKAGVPE